VVLGGFVGRRTELGRLVGCRGEVDAGRARLVLIEGAAGFGKTGLLAAFASALAGWQLLTASGDEAETRLPYGLLARLLAGAAPEWAAGLDPAGTQRPEAEDPFLVGAELVHVLGDLQDSGPVALVVDDAHWADPLSLSALTFALRRLQADRVLTVLTVRPEETQRLAPGLLRHGQDHGVLMQLNGLSTQEVRELATALGYGALPRRAADRLRAHTGGSPLHLRALFAELPIEELRGVQGRLPAPASFGPLVLAALAGCPEPARQLVASAAVLGVRSSLASAAAVAEVAQPLQALEDATRTQLVEARAADDGWIVAFRHPLIRAAVYDDLGPATRSRLHARAAGIVGEPDALAHSAAAAHAPDPTLVAQLVERAGEDVRSARPGRAADRLLAAARLSPPGTARDSLVLEAVGALLHAGEVNEAAQYTERIAAMPDTAKKELVQAQLAWLTGRHDAAEELASSAWEHGGQPALMGSAAALIAQLRILRGDGASAAHWAERALRCGGLPESVASTARMNQAIGLAMAGHFDDGLRVLADLPQDPSAVPPERQDELRVRGGLRLWADDLPGAYTDLRECAPGRSRWGLDPYGLIGLGYLAQVEYRRGAWDDSLVHAEQTVSLVTDTDQVWLQAFAHSVAVFVLAGRGLWVEAEAHTRAATDAAGALADLASIRYAADAAVHLASCRGDPAAVVEAAEPLRTSPPGGAHEPGIFGWAGEYAAALVALRRFDEAEAVLDRLGDVSEERGLRSGLAAVARVRGELAVARRAPADARAAFDAAVNLGADCASALDQARAHAAYGRFLRRAGERRAAGDRLRTARVAFARLGARPFLARCDAELAACGLAVDRPAGRAEVRLTPQEQAVTRLVCAGRSNREVAAELVISVKTVGYHLGNAYTKLGVSSRTQLAALLAQHRE
jgi:ATP/maltotriose-dependent transcriptional regulator MalT